MQNEQFGYVEDTKQANKLFSFKSELQCLRDRIHLSKNDKPLIQSSLDAYNISYIKYVILNNDKTISWTDAFKEIKKALKEGRKYYRLSIIHFYFFDYINKIKAIIKKTIKYKPKYKI